MPNSKVYRAIPNLFHSHKTFLIKQNPQTHNGHLPYNFCRSSRLPDTVWQYHVMDNGHHVVAHADKINESQSIAFTRYQIKKNYNAKLNKLSDKGSKS